MNRWGWFSTKCIVYMPLAHYHSNNVGKAANNDEPTHLLKLLYPRKWRENCDQCITISNRFCQIKQIEWAQPFGFSFSVSKWSIKFKWWKKFDKNSGVEKHLWKENLPPSSRSILMTSPDISVWKIIIIIIREQNKGQWGGGKQPGQVNCPETVMA